MSRAAPLAPAGVVTSQFHGRYGRMRGRAVGERTAGLPEFVLVQGLGVADYLLPALGVVGSWTRAHLLDLPGLAGSGDPPVELDLPGYAAAVRDWLDARPGTDPVVLAGHSAGTQVAARAAAGHPRVAGVVLAAPTVDPAIRGLLGLAVRWRRDGSLEPPGLTSSHLPEWRRAGPRRLLRLTRSCLADRIEDAIGALAVPYLVVYGADDRISDRGWARGLARLGAGRFAEVPGAHTFVWSHPDAWSAPVRDFAASVVGRPAHAGPPADLGRHVGQPDRGEIR